jgi:hypothetical protein
MLTVLLPVSHIPAATTAAAADSCRDALLRLLMAVMLVVSVWMWQGAAVVLLGDRGCGQQGAWDTEPDASVGSTCTNSVP